MKKIITIILSILLISISVSGDYKDHTRPLDERVADLISKMTLEEKASQLLDQSKAIPRLGIPYYSWWGECLHGVARFGRATVFPQAIGLAATFDEELVYRIASAISDEARAKYKAAVEIGNHGRYIGLTFWTPNINIFRDPRWGRGQETYGEDPFLTGRIGTAFVKGLQGKHKKYLKAAACAKHYAVHSGPEGERHSFNALPSKKDFYETYLPAFETLVKEAKVEAVMCAYNRTYDEPCCGSPFLLKKILREEWGFRGHILSDCWAISDFHQFHKVTASSVESAVKAIKSGVNLNCGITFKHLAKAVKKGLITEKDIDNALAILLRTRFKLGLFDPPGLNPYNAVGVEVIGCKKHRKLAREAALKSIVLLKNNNDVLPLNKKIKSLSVTGPNALNSDVLLGNYHGVAGELVTVLEGITRKVHPGTKLQYRQDFLLNRMHIKSADWSVGAAKEADAAIVVMGLTTLLEGEEGESLLSPFKGDRVDIGLPENQIIYLRKLRENNKKPIIVVLTGGSPIAAPEVQELADAVLFAWYPGEQGGNAVADIIFGDANPSGRLPVTFPKSTAQLPPYNDYSMNGRTYRYMRKEPLYPFGFGLSFTTFAYSNIKLSADSIKKGESIVVEVTVTNVGDVRGDEVVQLYITDLEAAVNVPLYALKGIKRLNLKAGEHKKVTFKVTPKMMSMVDNDGNRIIEPGKFKVTIGGSSPGKRSVELGAARHITALFAVK
jgi:beta-glucosidase